MLVHVAGAGHFVQPVGALYGLAQVELRCEGSGVGVRGDVSGVDALSVFLHPTLFELHVFHFHVFACGEHVIVGADVLERAGCGVGYFDTSLLATFGGDKDDTVAGTCAVDGCGSGILQYGDGLDVVGVERFQQVVGVSRLIDCARTEASGVVHGETVDDNQRLIAGSRRGFTTDAELGGATRLCRLQVDLQTCHLATQCMRDGGDGGAFYLLHIHRAYGTGQRFLALCAIAHYHHFFQQFGVFGKTDVHRTSGNSLHALRLVADVGDLEGCA